MIALGLFLAGVQAFSGFQTHLTESGRCVWAVGTIF